MTRFVRPVSKMTLQICLVLIVLTVGSGFQGCGGNDKKTAEKYIKSARDFIAQKKPETAVIEYKNAIEADPENHTALFELAETYVLLNKTGMAIRYYNLAAKSDPANLSPRLRLAQIYLRTDRLIDARSEIGKVLDTSPTSVNALHILSGIQIRERDLASAVETLEKAESIDPANVKTHTTLAQLYIKTKRFPAAVLSYRKAMAQDPASRSAYMGLARLWAIQKKWDKVETLLLSVVKTPGIPDRKYVDLAGFYEGRNKTDLAETYLKKAVAEAKDPLLPLMALSQFYARLNQKEKAVQSLETALAGNTNKALLLTGLSQVYLHFRELDSAEKYVDMALDKDKRFEDALFQKGRIMMERGRYKAALDLFEQVLGQNRVHGKAYYYRAICIRERGASDRPEQALFRAAAGMLDNPEEFEKNQVKENLLAALTIDPGLLDARFELASYYLLEKRADKAKKQIEAILERRPPDYRTMTLVAGVTLLEGDIKQAEAIFRAIVREQPSYSPARIRLGLLYKSGNQTQKALETLEQAYVTDPANLGLVKYIMDLYMDTGQYDIAMEKADAFFSLAGKNTAAFFMNTKGEIQVRKGDLGEGERYFSRAIELDDTYIRPLMNMAGVSLVRRDLTTALGYFQAVEKIDPDFLPALRAIGTIYDVKNDLENAKIHYEKILKINPRDPAAVNNLAFILCEDNSRLEEAFRLAKFALDLKPGDPDVLDTMGWAFFQKGSYLNALSAFEESLKINPDNPLTHYHYGMALYKTKQFGEARNHMRRALKLKSDFRGADMARKMLY